jgi:hypothetical protein
LSIDFFAYDFPMRRLAQTNKPIATKNTKKATSHTGVSRALISAANRVPVKYDFANRETAAPMGARLMIESTQRPFVRPLAKPRRVFFVAIGLSVCACPSLVAAMSRWVIRG